MFMKFLFLALFVAVMIGVGIYSRKKINNEQDFLLGGRKMGPWISAFAMVQHIFSGYFHRLCRKKRMEFWNFCRLDWNRKCSFRLSSLLACPCKENRKMTHDLNVSTMPISLKKDMTARV